MVANPRVSVVMAVFNGEIHVAESIESILDQTFQDFELIIVDDGSEDGTELVVRGYLSQPNVRLVRQENAGGAAARNVGIQVARGEFIAIQDHDDVSLQTRLAVQVAALEENPDCELVFSPVVFIDELGRELRTWGGIGRQLDQAEAFYELYVNGIFIPDPSVMIRRRHMGSSGPYDSSLKVAFDFDHFLRLTHDWPILEIPERLVKVRRRPEGLTHDFERNKATEAEIRRRIRSLYSDKPPLVTRRIYWRAMSNQKRGEATKYLSRGQRIRAVARLASAWLFDPTNPDLLRQTSTWAVRSLKRLRMTGDDVSP